MYWVKRIWFPGWLFLFSCAFSSERNACYGMADAWLYDQAQQCENRGYAWAQCPERPAALEEHKKKETQCP